MLLWFLRVLESGDQDGLKRLLADADLLSTRDSNMNNLLHYASITGNVEAARLLLEAGLHPDSANLMGLTPLCDASLNGSIELISLLLNHGANVNPPHTPTSPVTHATFQGHVDALRLLTRAGADLNVIDGLGNQPLHVAVRRKFYAGAQILLLAGADVNCRRKLKTPLHMAAKRNDILMATILLAHGADPLLMDKKNRSPLDCAPPDSELFHLLRAIQGKVPSLKFLTRLAFRKVIFTCDLEKSNELHLPTSLLDYLLFKRLY